MDGRPHLCVSGLEPVPGLGTARFCVVGRGGVSAWGKSWLAIRRLRRSLAVVLSECSVYFHRRRSSHDLFLRAFLGGLGPDPFVRFDRPGAWVPFFVSYARGGSEASWRPGKLALHCGRRSTERVRDLPGPLSEVQ